MNAPKAQTTELTDLALEEQFGLIGIFKLAHEALALRRAAGVEATGLHLHAITAKLVAAERERDALREDRDSWQAVAETDATQMQYAMDALRERLAEAEDALRDYRAHEEPRWNTRARAYFAKHGA